MIHDVVLIPGDGIGPEITDAVVRILDAAGAPLRYHHALAGMGAFQATGNPLPEETIQLIDQYRLVLKGPLETPVGGGFRSINVSLRQRYNLYSNIRPAKTLAGIATPFRDVDLVLFRENTQGLYIGHEKWIDVDHNHAESTAVVTREASERIITAAFEFARKSGRKTVHLVHKANILKLTSGLFLQIGREVAERYRDIAFRDIIVDNMAMQMVIKPSQFDVVVTTNLFGDILSDLASGLVGGLGLTGSANIGYYCAMFEAVHGSAPDIAGQNKANPTALLFSALMLLDHIGDTERASRIRSATEAVLADPNLRTGDLGGKGSTSSFAEAVIGRL